MVKLPRSQYVWVCWVPGGGMLLFPVCSTFRVTLNLFVCLLDYNLHTWVSMHSIKEDPFHCMHKHLQTNRLIKRLQNIWISTYFILTSQGLKLLAMRYSLVSPFIFLSYLIYLRFYPFFMWWLRKSSYKIIVKNIQPLSVWQRIGKTCDLGVEAGC